MGASMGASTGLLDERLDSKARRADLFPSYRLARPDFVEMRCCPRRREGWGLRPKLRARVESPK